jgi:N-formylglutamate amidohydrolase
MNVAPPIVLPAAKAARFETAAYVVHRAADEPASPLVFASPHSGRHYPADMMDASLLDAAAIRLSEDAFVDELILAAVDHGATVITAAYARAYIDVNREPYELDASMFEDELPDFARGRSARVAAGLGSIARIVAEGQEIYARKLTFAEASRRIEMVHQPYHAALEDLLGQARAKFGVAVLVDWHSMPAAAARTYGQSGDAGRGRSGAGVLDLVLGDRFGAACAPAITTLVERELEAMGYRVARNAPYAGGYTTEFYGKPANHTHALQIEINRGLYLDEATLEPREGFARLKRDLERVFAALAQGAQGGDPD